MSTHHTPVLYLCLFLPFVECVCQEGEALVGLVHQGPIGPQALMISYEIDIKTNEQTIFINEVKQFDCALFFSCPGKLNR